MKKIIMTENHKYDSDFKLGDHHYAELFSQSHKILWLNPIYNYMIFIKDKKEYYYRKNFHKKNFVNRKKNIYIYSPYSLVLYGNYPIFKRKIFSKLSINLTIPNIKGVLKKNNFMEVDILWLSNPKYYYLSKLVKYKKLFYRCADDLSKFSSVPVSMIDLENKIIKEADKVFVTSHDLMNKKKNIRKDFIYLPNGVELDNFNRDIYRLPNEFKNSNCKKVIYVGAIDSWFDVNLIKYCAEKLDNINFYLIGNVKIDLSVLKQFRNVFILGKRDYKHISDYLYYSDIGIIPFEVNSLTNSVSPIKLYEYMSVGLNVVSTNFKEMEYINSPAYVAKNYDEFCNYIVQAIENKERNRERNIQFAKKNTWEKRFEEIQKYIEKD
jgi:hypothetical protein